MNKDLKEITVGIDGSNVRSGGGVKHLVEILNHADPQLHGIKKVILWTPQSLAKEFPDRDWLEVVAVARAENPAYRFLWTNLSLKRQVSRRCDVVFYPGGISLRTRVPDVAMSQNMQPFVESERKSVKWGLLRLRLEILRILQGRSFSQAKARVFLTEYARDTIRSQYPFPATDTVEIPHGIDPEFFFERPTERTAVSSETSQKVVYVSTVNVYKHQLEVVKAMGLLAAKWKGLSLDLIGGVYDTAYHAEVTKAIDEVNAQHNRDVVNYVGKVPFDKLPEIYQQADMSVFASSCENLPNILLESMAASLPTVCSTYSPMPEVLGDGGLYCDVNSPDSIAEAISRFLESPELGVEKSKIAYQIATNYSWKTTADKTFALLARVARSQQVNGAVQTVPTTAADNTE